MTVFKKILCISLLITVTALTVLFPEILSSYRTNLRTEKTEYYSLNTANSVTLTSSTVAELLCKADTTYQTDSNSATNVIMNNAEYTGSGIGEATEALFDTVFGANTQICNYFKKVIGDNIPYCTRNYILTVVDDRPVALSIVTISFKNGFEYFDFSYEEKTKTLISLSYVSFSEVMTNKYDTVLSFSDMQSAIEKYCRTVLKINKNNYFFENYTKNTAVAHENIINFSLAQNEEEYMSEKESDIQN